MSNMDEDENALYIEHDTDIDELIGYVEECSTDPYIDESGNIIWNFSTYEIDDEVDLGSKDCDEFLIPYQPSGAWAVIYTMLPERIRNAEVLVWRSDVQEYYAYRQFYRDLPNEKRGDIKNDLARKVHEQLS